MLAFTYTKIKKIMGHNKKNILKKERERERKKQKKRRKKF
jgi:hypothetical protein